MALALTAKRLMFGPGNLGPTCENNPVPLQKHIQGTTNSLYYRHLYFPVQNISTLFYFLKEASRIYTKATRNFLWRDTVVIAPRSAIDRIVTITTPARTPPSPTSSATLPIFHFSHQELDDNVTAGLYWVRLRMFPSEQSGKGYEVNGSLG